MRKKLMMTFLGCYVNEPRLGLLASSTKYVKPYDKLVIDGYLINVLNPNDKEHDRVWYALTLKGYEYLEKYKN